MQFDLHHVCGSRYQQEYGRVESTNLPEREELLVLDVVRSDFFHQSMWPPDEYSDDKDAGEDSP